MARNSDQNQRVREERRERILTGALELFARNGLAGTKISDIAKHTAMSNGLVYHYFPSKEDIFIELIRTAFERLILACGYLESLTLPPHRKLLHAMDELVHTFRTSPTACLYHMLIAQATAAENIPAGARDILEQNRNIPYATMARVIAQGQEQGTIRPGKPDDLAFFFWVNINGIAQHQAMYGETAQCPDLAPLHRLYLTSKELP